MADGSVETHPLKCDPMIVGKEGPDSDTLHLFAATARDNPEVTLGLSVLFGCHPTVMPRQNDMISSDYPGKVRDRMVGQLCQECGEEGRSGSAAVLFFQAASGNICQCNPLDGCSCEVGLEHSKKMGKGIGDCALRLREHLQVAQGPLKVASQTPKVRRRDLDPALVAWAQQHKPVQGLSCPTLSDYGTERFDSGAASLEAFFKSPWWANMYAEEIKTLHGTFEKVLDLPQPLGS